MAETVLFVDDEENILHSLARLFADSDLRILRAGSGREALSLLRNENVAVLVTDNMMPGMRGVDLLSAAKELSPVTARVLMTAHADLPTAIDAINRGEVFRFVMKPWEDEELLRTVQEGLVRHRLVESVRTGDEATLLSLAQTIELKDPYTRGHCERVAGYAGMIASSLRLPESARREIKHGSWLHDCGKIGVPEAILNRCGPLEEKDFEVVKKHPGWGAEVARQARLSDVVVNIILYHHERYDGNGYPGGIARGDIPLEARIVAVADAFDAITTDRPYQTASSLEEAMGILGHGKGNRFDPAVVDAFLSLRQEICIGSSSS